MGHLLAPHARLIRTEEDVLAPVQAIVATDPTATRWHVVYDHLAMPSSESLMRWAARISGGETDMGTKGMPALMPRRAACVRDPTQKVVFHFTPNQRSWMKHSDIWLSILVRTLLRRGPFTSVQDLETSVLACIDSSRPEDPSCGPLKARHGPSQRPKD